VEVQVQRDKRVESIFAEAAIITVPLGVLKAGSIKFEPDLAKKRDAIQELEFGEVVRMAIFFREYWWPKRDFGFIHALDETVPTWWSDPRGPVLIGWAGGPSAHALLRYSRAQLEALCVNILARLFSERAASVRAQLVQLHTHNWARDPYARGAYSYIPVNGLDLPKLLAEPVGDALFFAGEATVSDAQCGTVSGALESGLRAAHQILAG
jgi:monoamine oxidase